MKITIRWLEEFTAVGVPAARLAEQLTLAGLEVESLEPVAPPSEGVVVGEVLATAPHPNADRLSVCQVSIGGTGRLQIVCGAPNVRPGLKVAVAVDGAALPNDVRIRRVRLRGVDSAGMLCSARELGLGEEHDGILELPPDLAPGRALREALDLDDVVLEVKATPNRGDCMSVFGIARDYAAARELRHLRHVPRPVQARTTDAVAVRLEAGAACPVFAGRVIRGIASGAATPAWLRERLRRVGVHSISPVVDVTNYVMLELGQPMHAYDLAEIDGSIHARWADAGEGIRLLDDREYALDPEYLVIADDRGPIGLAGIMGGRASAISASTRDVFLEAAHFAPGAVAGRARRLGLFTDAAQRFERGVDPGLPAAAIERASALLLEIVGGEPGPVHIERLPVAAAGAQVALRRDRLARLLGTQVPDEEARGVLAAICDRVEETADGWRVEAPAHRFDMRIEADLIEEIARLRGFDTIPAAHAVVPQIAGSAAEAFVSNERVLTAFIDRGYREAITYSFVEPALQRLLFPGVPALALANPISTDLAEMRVSLWPGLIKACADNLRRQQPRVRLVEIGRKFELEGATLREIDMVAGIATGSRWPEQWGSPRQAIDFFDVKGDVLGVLALTGAAETVSLQAATHASLHPGRAARIVRGEQRLGWLGELHPQVAKSLDLPAGILVFELEIELSFKSKDLKFQNISKFPVIRRDLAIVVDEAVSLAVLQKTVTVSASGLLSELRIFDVYRGPGIDFGRKSIALGLILQDSSRTLTDVEADAVVSAVVARLRDELSATIRDQ
jgi:phenylalanyl-tRNA synthetase beta chain